MPLKSLIFIASNFYRDHINYPHSSERVKCLNLKWPLLCRPRREFPNQLGWFGFQVLDPGCQELEAGETPDVGRFSAQRFALVGWLGFQFLDPGCQALEAGETPGWGGFCFQSGAKLSSCSGWAKAANPSRANKNNFIDYIKLKPKIYLNRRSQRSKIAEIDRFLILFLKNVIY